MGFKLVSIIKETTFDCNVINDPLFLSAIILSNFNKEDITLNTIRCQGELLTNKELKYILNYGTIRFPISRKEKEMIERKWNSIKQLEQMVDRFLEIDFKQLGTKSRSYIVKQLDYFQKYNHLESFVAQLFLYQAIDNLGAQSEVINKILNQNFQNFFLEREYLYYKEEVVQEKLVSLIIDYLDAQPYNNKKNYFVLKLIYDANKAFKDKLEEEISLPALIELKNLLKSPNYGARNLNVWVSWGFENLPPKTNSLIFDSYFENTDWKNLLDLKYHYIKKPKIREKVLSRINMLKNSTNIYKQSTYFELANNGSWNDYLSTKIENFKINLIKSKRKFYRKLIFEGIGGAYPVFELFKMGDINRDYFLYLLAIKSYGIPSTQILPIQ